MMKSLSQEHVPPLFRVQEFNGLDLFEVTVDSLQRYYEQGLLTSVNYVGFCLERIRAIDPYLEAVIELNPDAIQIATDMDKERQNGNIRGPLHGIPVLVKDNMATRDKMQTTAGSWALLGSIVPRDAHVVSSLRKAGAVVLGHANMSEWSSIRSKQYSTGYSPRRGQVRNAFNLSKTPFGSSGGSAVAVSANIVPISLGTETDTSVIGPASINGVVGIKPTVGLTSRSGVIPISHNFDTVGVFGRTVLDASYALSAIAGTDERDPATLHYPGDRIHDYAVFVNSKECLKGARFGLPNKGCWEFIADDIRVVASKVLTIIRDAGVQVIETDFPCADERIPPGGEWDWEYGKPSESEFTVCKVDAYNDIKAYLEECTGTTIKTIEDVVAYNEANQGAEGAFPGDHAAFPTGQDNFHECIKTQGIEDSTYHAALNYVHRKSREEGIDAALQCTADDRAENFDALIIFDRKSAGQQMAAQAGYPIITIPVGLDSNGMPIGLSFQHTAWREQDLIKWASAVEDLLRSEVGWRATPSFRDFTAKNIPIRSA